MDQHVPSLGICALKSSQHHQGTPKIEEFKIAEDIRPRHHEEKSPRESVKKHRRAVTLGLAQR